MSTRREFLKQAGATIGLLLISCKSPTPTPENQPVNRLEFEALNPESKIIGDKTAEQLLRPQIQPEEKVLAVMQFKGLSQKKAAAHTITIAAVGSDKAKKPSSYVIDSAGNTYGLLEIEGDDTKKDSSTMYFYFTAKDKKTYSLFEFNFKNFGLADAKFYDPLGTSIAPYTGSQGIQISSGLSQEAIKKIQDDLKNAGHTESRLMWKLFTIATSADRSFRLPTVTPTAAPSPTFTPRPSQDLSSPSKDAKVIEITGYTGLVRQQREPLDCELTLAAIIMEMKLGKSKESYGWEYTIDTAVGWKKNPHKGFRGNSRGQISLLPCEDQFHCNHGYGVYAEPLKKAFDRWNVKTEVEYAKSAKGSLPLLKLSQQEMAAEYRRLREHIDKGEPVIVWMAYDDSFKGQTRDEIDADLPPTDPLANYHLVMGEHVLLITGYEKNGNFIAIDPLIGGFVKMKSIPHWLDQFNGMRLVVQK